MNKNSDRVRKTYHWSALGYALIIIITLVVCTMGTAMSGQDDPFQRLPLNGPTGIIVDPFGCFYVADTGNNRIMRICDPTSPNPTITRIAGTGVPGPRGDGMPATLAQLNHPVGVALDGNRNLYIADSLNNVIRMVTPGADGVVNGEPDEIITTIAGSLVPGCGGDNRLAQQAQLSMPRGIVVDASGMLYIADSLCNSLRKVDLNTGIITTVVRGLRMPSDVEEENGALYVADTGNNRVCRVEGSGCAPVVGNGSGSFCGEGGHATRACLWNLRGIGIGLLGLYIADTFNHRIRLVTRDGIIRTIAGSGPIGPGSGDYGGDVGPATLARLNEPSDVAVDFSGNVFIADTKNNRIRWVDTNGIIRTIVGP
ncbi:MAG: hypothetical protein HY314_13570 [Acidobacteria bacterium]|nr:hypothetical protein [Acidobacteriota bacterium]